MTSPLSDLTLIVPEIFVLSMITLILLLGLFAKAVLVGRLSYLLTQITLIGLCILTFRFFDASVATAFGHMFVHDPLEQVLKLFVYLSTIFTLAYARQYIEDRAIPQMEYYLLTLFSVLGMMVLLSAHHFLVLYIGLELFSLPIYAMIALQRDARLGAEAAMKYFVTGAVASGILLYGISMLFGAANTLDFSMLASTVAIADHIMLYRFALVFIIVGAAFKLGAVPFHMWVPDVYQGSPTSVTLFIGSAAKLTALGLLFRLLVTALPALQVHWAPILISIAVASIVLGNFVAIVQRNIKRMLAYSSIAHMGYLLLGILTGTVAGYAASLFYMIVYAIMATGAFGLLILLSRAGVEVEDLNDLKGLNANHPWLALMMLLLMFSMAGIPPTVGFFAKLGVLQALVSVHFVWLATLALVFAVVGAYYYIRVVKIMYFDEPDKHSINAVSISSDMSFVLSINALAVLVLGIFPSTLIDFCRSVFSI